VLKHQRNRAALHCTSGESMAIDRHAGHGDEQVARRHLARVGLQLPHSEAGPPV